MFLIPPVITLNNIIMTSKTHIAIVHFFIICLTSLCVLFIVFFNDIFIPIIVNNINKKCSFVKIPQGSYSPCFANIGIYLHLSLCDYIKKHLFIQ